MRIDPVKGTRDFYPEKMRFRNWFFDTCRRVAGRFGYEEYDGPFLEPFELYARKSGEELVNEQTYTLSSRGGEQERLAIRPEMTPTLARMIAARQQDLRKPIRWFSIPSCWRYEAPQRGRKREFYQFNVDLVGSDSLDADAEVLAVTVALLRELGLKQGEFVIRVNNRYYLESLFEALSIDRGFYGQVIHQIDRMEKIGRAAFEEALLKIGLSARNIEGLLDRLDRRSCAGFGPLEELFARIAPYGISGDVAFDPTIARGLLYYTGTVFEIWDQSTRLRRAVAGGGRYDDLVTALGGDRLPGVGIALSDVVIESILEPLNRMPACARQLDVYVAQYRPDQRTAAVEIAQSLRAAGRSVELNILDVRLDKQLKAASAAGARYAVVVAPDELARGEVNLKDLATREQRTLPIQDLAASIL